LEQGSIDIAACLAAACRRNQMPPQQHIRKVALLVFGTRCCAAAAGLCSLPGEDCSHTACCTEPFLQCYKENDLFASCRPSCERGVHIFDAEELRSPWSCELVNKSHPACANDDSNCIHLGCCKALGHKCFLKNTGEAFCRASPPAGWLGHEIRPQVPKGDALQLVDSSSASDPTLWNVGLTSGHYWDCKGQSCDATHLQPWDISKYVAPPEYAPMNPDNYGGSDYGERIWMIGAVSDTLSSFLGPDANNCGSDNGGGGGCGRCMLIGNPDAKNKEWTAVVMKKSRCNPWDLGCGDGQFHLDLAVPGFDRPESGASNVCGIDGTTLSRHLSSVCGGGPPDSCNCSKLPMRNSAQRRMKSGCEIFRAWGWRSGNPVLEWHAVPCPWKFIEQVQLGRAFGPQGPVTVTSNEFIDVSQGPIGGWRNTGPDRDGVHILNGTNLVAVASEGSREAGGDRDGLQSLHKTNLVAVASASLLPALAMMMCVRGILVVNRHRQEQLELQEQAVDDAEALLTAE